MAPGRWPGGMFVSLVLQPSRSVLTLNPSIARSSSLTSLRYPSSVVQKLLSWTCAPVCLTCVKSSLTSFWRFGPGLGGGGMGGRAGTRREEEEEEEGWEKVMLWWTVGGGVQSGRDRAAWARGRPGWESGLSISIGSTKKRACRPTLLGPSPCTLSLSLRPPGTPGVCALSTAGLLYREWVCELVRAAASKGRSSVNYLVIGRLHPPCGLTWAIGQFWARGGDDLV